MNKLLSLPEFVNAYKQSHPHDTVKKKVTEGISLWSRLGILLALTAVNILSASHTIPIILDTIDVTDPTLQRIIAVAAFVAIEFTMILFMVFGESGWLRTGVISGALIVAVVANLTNTISNLNTALGANPGTGIVGVVLGLFAPLANLGVGEVYRSMKERNDAANEKAEDNYKEELKAWDARVRGQYSGYLTKNGIPKADHIAYMAGIVTEPVPVAPPIHKATKPRQQGGGKKLDELVELMLTDESYNDTYVNLQNRYGVSATSVRQAKARIAEIRA